MPALSGEPWRGAAVARLEVTAVPTNFHSAWVSFDVNTAQPSGDQSTWQGSPGGSLTLRFRRTTGGTGSGTGAATAPNFATVRAMLPGGAQIGTDWSVAFPAVDTEVTRTFHFDDDPMNSVLGAIRSGMVELYVIWGNTGGIAPWTVDSRGATTGTIVGTDQVQNARGYARADCIVSNDPAPSNVGIGGASPALFAAPDPIHTRVSLSAVKYRSVGLELELVRTGTSTMERESTVTQTSVNHDYSWTGTTGNNRRVGNGMFLGNEAKDLKVKMAALDFGGDNEYVFASSGHDVGWTVTSALELTNASELTVDPRLTPRNDGDINGDAPGALFHPQTLGQTFLDPPSSGDDPTGQRAFPFVGYVSVRYSNARGEGQNGLTVTLKMWDVDGILGTESSPAETFSGTTRLTPDPPPAPASPEAGWLPLSASGADENKLPITWDGVAAGTWRVKSVLTAPSDLTGLEEYPNSSGGATWNRNLFFVASSPNFGAVISIHPENIAHHGTHLTPDDELIPVCYLIDHSTNKLVELDESNGDRVNIKIVREHHPTMRMDYFDFDTETWVGKPNQGEILSNLDLIRGDAHASSLGTGDPDVWTTSSHLGGEIFAPDGAAGELDAMIIVDIVYNGVHYSAFAPVILVAVLNKHNEDSTPINM